MGFDALKHSIENYTFPKIFKIFFGLSNALQPLSLEFAF